MTFIVDGTNGATFPDTTVQTTALTTGAVTKTMISTSTSTGFGLCRAWVNADGTNGSIRGSYNVSSVTRNSTGDYTIAFTTAMTNANYSIAGMAQRIIANSDLYVGLVFGASMNQTASSVRVQTRTGGSSIEDCTVLAISIFGV
jgi:hypothetical protein